MTTKPASEKQINLITKLMSEKIVSEELNLRASEVMLGLADISVASQVIGELFKCAKQTKADAVTEVGFYYLLNEIYKVQKSASGHFYAKQLVIHGSHTSWDYAPGAFKSLSCHNVMTAEQAMSFGKLTGHCFCGRELSDDISRAHYMGPVCSTNTFGIKRSKSQKAYAEAAEILLARGETPNGMPTKALVDA
jgi:hypothetical protein